MTTFNVMDGSLCASKHDSYLEAQAEIKKLRFELENQVNIAEQDLEDFNENVSIGEQE